MCNTKGYAKHVKKVYTEEEFIEAAKSSREKAEYLRSIERKELAE